MEYDAVQHNHIILFNSPGVPTYSHLPYVLFYLPSGQHYNTVVSYGLPAGVDPFIFENFNVERGTGKSIPDTCVGAWYFVATNNAINSTQ